jgi:Nif-specific regulatory protein
VLRLKLISTGETFDFEPLADVMTIGRAETNHITVDNPHVSALHGQITCRSEGYAYQDLKSTNGSAVEREGRKTAVDGIDVVYFPLTQNDRIMLGSEEEPAVLKVIQCVQPIVGIPKGATVVATHRMASAGDAGDRIESEGGTLVPQLRLMENLNRANYKDAACRAFSESLREQLPAVTAVTVADSDSLQESPGTDRRSLIETDASGKGAAWIPIEVDSKTLLWALVESAQKGFSPAELNILTLAANLLATRLCQMNLVGQLEKARASLAAKNRYLQKKAESRASETIVGNSKALQTLTEQIRKVAISDATVLITGPSGSGKELVAREIHRLSLRHAEIFVAVNCGALAESLLETELFGCKQGAFTGAVRDREGLFEVAHGGTLFLDEIGDMSTALQVKLLRVLETGEVTPVGDTRPRKVNVRVLTATHRDLQAKMASGSFREDLFYRIHVFPIQVPPLSARPADIPLLARHFMQKYTEEHGCSVHEITAEAMRVLSSRKYPGNVRQLANEIQRAVLLAGDLKRIEVEHLSEAQEDTTARAAGQASGKTLKEQMASVESVLIREALARHEGNRTHTAKHMGITRQALRVKMNKLGIE